MTGSEQSDSVQRGPERPRNERAVRHRIAVAVTEADELLRICLTYGAIDERSHHRIREARGLLAEWRVEGD